MSTWRPPWAIVGAGWSIVGMNHFEEAGEKWLYVAMKKGDRCIVEQGPDDKFLWNRLWLKARGPES